MYFLKLLLCWPKYTYVHFANFTIRDSSLQDFFSEINLLAQMYFDEVCAL